MMKMMLVMVMVMVMMIMMMMIIIIMIDIPYFSLSAYATVAHLLRYGFIQFNFIEVLFVIHLCINTWNYVNSMWII
jgi:hypothetical protein